MWHRGAVADTNIESSILIGLGHSEETLAKQPDTGRTAATSPAASGPAGQLFEGQVGAHYLLAMLANGDPRGLPGTVVARVEFQRASEGRALDDVIVYAHDRHGVGAVLEIQVKRTISFTASDAEFRAVIAQIVKTAARKDFDSTRYELAVAIERTSTKIERAYQQVLTRARHFDSPEAFHTHVGRVGLANEDMRKFVATFRNNLELAGADHDDAAVWRLLRRFQILVFNFNQEGSSSELLERDRAAMVLSPQDRPRAAELWTLLTNLALESAANAGERSVASLREILTTTKYGYKFSGDLRLAVARGIIIEASTAALADIGDHVGGVRIDRSRRVEQVYAALDIGRYVEIRGDAGVGKSGVLKHLADQIALETGAIVLSPDRTPPNGWISLQSSIGCEVSAREFLLDFAVDGSAILFVDSVDFIESEAQRATVRDLVRAAAEIPNFSVVVTARSDFAKEEPSWLPVEALDRLGRVTPILIDELNENEIEQLTAANDSLALLLTDSHPARDVVRNLFRLARLVGQSPDEPLPLTEADMADQWWRSGDGAKSGRRELLRLLRELTVHALATGNPLNVANHPDIAIQTLVGSGSIRELRHDFVVFRHDVLREWAIGCLLRDEPERIDDLPLDQPAPSSLVRGVELAARFSAEHAQDSERWKSLLIRLSDSKVHGSWRRAVLLAIVRSELGGTLLIRVSDVLFADNGTILRDLIRLTIAVDSGSAAKVYSASGIDLKALPADFVVPTSHSWSRLIIWSLAVMPQIPKANIPDLVDLYSKWSMAMFGGDPLTPHLLTHLYGWLVEIESARYSGKIQDMRRSFGINLPSISDLETIVRSNFLLFCRRTPELAERYLRAAAMRPPGHQASLNIMKFRGSAAQVAPAALVDLTLRTLIPESDDEGVYSRRDFGPYDVNDSDFLPASPSQGPFYEILEASSSEGLRLVRRIVEHAIDYRRRGQDALTNVIVIPFPDGSRAFPWSESYTWARGQGHSYIVTSALMALEAWGHRRIEAGHSVKDVVADVLGGESPPAAFLLIAVDLLISHWPKSAEAAWPFLACPELLTLDVTRYGLDSVNDDDLFGFSGLAPSEPRGQVSLSSLRQRQSRHFSLDELIGYYAVGDRQQMLGLLRSELLIAIERLGPPGEPSMGMGDFCFAAKHALNLTDPANWKKIVVAKSDGSEEIRWQYHPPAEERAMLEPGQMQSTAKSVELNFRMALATALENRAKSSVEFARQAISWALKSYDRLDEDDEAWALRSRLIAAAVAMRDGDDNLYAAHAAWARLKFAEVLRTANDRHSHHPTISFDVVTIATIGLIGMVRHERRPEDVRALLELSAKGGRSAAYVFEIEAQTLNEIDNRLPRSVLRVGFAACIHAFRKYEETDNNYANRVSTHRRRISRATEREVAWLNGKEPEPTWPVFPAGFSRPKRRPFRAPGGETVSSQVARGQEWKRPLSIVDHNTAAMWLQISVPLIGRASTHWLPALIEKYARWTASHNGVGLVDDEDGEDIPTEWNHVFFDLVVRSSVGLPMDAFDSFVLNRIRELPDKSFYSVLPHFIHTIDGLCLNDKAFEIEEWARIRSLLNRRLIESQGWHWVTQRNSSRIEFHIAPAIAAMFLHSYSHVTAPKCYVSPKKDEILDALMPSLTELTFQASGSTFVATLFLNVIDVRLQPQHLGYLVRCAIAWLGRYPGDAEFWVGQGIGGRVCAWLDKVIRSQPSVFLMATADISELNKLLDLILRIGVAPARAIEEAFAQIRLRDHSGRL